MSYRVVTTAAVPFTASSRAVNVLVITAYAAALLYSIVVGSVTGALAAFLIATLATVILLSLRSSPAPMVGRGAVASTGLPKLPIAASLLAIALAIPAFLVHDYVIAAVALAIAVASVAYALTRGRVAALVCKVLALYLVAALVASAVGAVAGFTVPVWVKVLAALVATPLLKTEVPVAAGTYRVVVSRPPR